MPMFRVKHTDVEARQVTRENGAEIASWCFGQFLSLYGRGDRGEDISHVAIRDGDGYRRAHLGEWVVEVSDGTFDAVTDKAFMAAFEPIVMDADFRQVGEEPTPDQRPGPAEAIANIEAFLRDMAKEPYGDDADQLVATAPMDPPDGGSRQQGMITIGDLQAVLAAFRPWPSPVIEVTRKRLAEIEARWNDNPDNLLDMGQINFLIRLAKSYLDSPMAADPAPALKERAEICKALGCVDKPGVPLQFVLKLQEANANHWRRQVELLRSWDKATPTERQELDRLRRGWGPPSPTERMRRREDIATALQAISVAMRDVTVHEEDEDVVPQEARDRLDQAYERLAAQHTKLVETVHAIVAEPQEWPDIKAAEERGAMRALSKVDLTRLHATGVTSMNWMMFTQEQSLEIRQKYLPAVIESITANAVLGSIPTKPPFRTGDCVVNKHNGEEMTVAWADPETGYFHWFGHPPGRARSSDFRLSLAANEEVHKLALLQLKRSGGPVAEKALALYGDPEATP